MKRCFSYIPAFAIFFNASLSYTYAQNGTLKGKIKSEGEVLQAATVSAGKKTVFTNEAGEFIIKLKPGAYTLNVSYTGYQPVRQEVKVSAGETTELDLTLETSEQLNAVVVLGSRSAIQRSNMNTPVPVDVISGSQLPQLQTDLTQQLSVIVPSFNSPPQTIGTSAWVNPATLRGLGPDETLVLLNGRRLHTSANVFLQYNMAYGTACTDLNTIPSAAIEKIEVLRDGAAAQYGSDAIAGVLNLQLKRSTGVSSMNLQLGETYKGDGETIAFNFNRGIVLNKKGSLNFTADIRFKNFTQRNGVYDSTVYYPFPPGASQQQKDGIIILDNQKITKRGFDRLNHRPVGNPKMLNTALIINGAYPLSSKTNLFWTGTLNYRLTEDRASAGYRYPKDTTTVITTLYPDGFQPKIFNTILDMSFIAGIEGKTGKGWQWNFSSIFGGNSSNLKVANSNNASQFNVGKYAQTCFNTGTVLFTQNTNNINFTRNFANLLRDLKSFTVSFGGEFRIDHYQIKKGEEASWKNYAPLSGQQWGSQGVVGFDSTNEVNKNRYVGAGYAELEVDMNEKFLWNLATRYEYYNDFGGNLAGKLAVRYKFSDRFLLRGSLSNGFRAPAIQQRYYSAINQISGRGVLGILVTGTYRNDSKEAVGFGISPLTAERSVNISSGITSKISRHINITLDAYWIQISNRIIITGAIQRNPVTTPRVGEILDSLGHPEINAVRFFTNAISTRTKGIDLVATGIWRIHKSMLEVTLSGNYNKTNIYHTIQPAKNLPDDAVYQFTIISPEERGRLEQAQPLDKIILAVTYKTSKWEFGARSIYFGKVAHIFNGADRSRDEFFSPKILHGFLIGYSPKTWISIKIGAGNIFNSYPDKIKNRANTQAGLAIYDFNSTQIGLNGGYYFVSMNFNF